MVGKIQIQPKFYPVEGSNNVLQFSEGGMCSQHFMEIMSLVFVKLRDETGFENQQELKRIGRTFQKKRNEQHLWGTFMGN